MTTRWHTLYQTPATHTIQARTKKLVLSNISQFITDVVNFGQTVLKLVCFYVLFQWLFELLYLFSVFFTKTDLKPGGYLM